jgi:hypothetical protein
MTRENATKIAGGERAARRDTRTARRMTTGIGEWASIRGMTQPVGSFNKLLAR